MIKLIITKSDGTEVVNSNLPVVSMQQTVGPFIGTHMIVQDVNQDPLFERP